MGNGKTICTEKKGEMENVYVKNGVGVITSGLSKVAVVTTSAFGLLKGELSGQL